MERDPANQLACTLYSHTKLLLFPVRALGLGSCPRSQQTEGQRGTAPEMAPRLPSSLRFLKILQS
jgi:hypothetical protein